MSALENSGASVKEAEPVSKADFLWGVAQIAPVIGRTERQANHLLAAGHIKSARKVGGIWFANRDALLKEFGAA
jgi:hypothetical protein